MNEQKIWKYLAPEKNFYDSVWKKWLEEVIAIDTPKSFSREAAQ